MEAIWNANPTVNMLYCFEDGNCFVRHGDAASHAKTTGMAYTVKTREVAEVPKAEVIKEEEEIIIKSTTKTKK